MSKLISVIPPLLVAVFSAVAGFLLYSQMQTGSDAGSAVSSPAVSEENPVGRMLPAAKFPALDGTVHSLAQWRGKVVLMNFWATWCPPCREEIPDLVKLHEKYVAHDFQVLGIAIDDVDPTTKFVDQMEMPYDNLIGDRSAAGFLAALGNPRGLLPYSVLIDRDGVVRYVHRGVIRPDKAEAKIEPLL